VRSFIRRIEANGLRWWFPDIGDVMAEKNTTETSNKRSSQATTDSPRQGSTQSSQTSQASDNRSQQTGLATRQGIAPALMGGPFGLIRQLNEEMYRLFEAVSSGRAGRFDDEALDPSAWTPNVEVFERDGNLVVRADLPGTGKEDITVELDDDSVALRGERRFERSEERGGVYRNEVAYGTFFRRIPLPEGADTTQATAVFRDGVLEIMMPAPKRESNTRQLEVQDAGDRQGEPARTSTASASK
jgi:HSP20 family protein